jgi:hypothetical protein
MLTADGEGSRVSEQPITPVNDVHGLRANKV